MRLSLCLPRVSTAVLIAGCSAPAAPPIVPVVATDYAFTAPDTAAAGLTAFTLENRGAQQHEMHIGLLRPGVAPTQIVEAAQRGMNFRLLPEVYLEGAMRGALFAWPGTTSAARLTLELVRGRSYILLCTFRDSTTAPQHAALGMFHILQVK
jgi:hypothetical protein